MNCFLYICDCCVPVCFLSTQVAVFVFAAIVNNFITFQHKKYR